MRPISTETFNPIEIQPDPGAVPMLQWIPITELVVDDSYQRMMNIDSRRNVRAIAEGFRWSKFAPVVVSPVEGGKYAIVDGQHRTTAAALLSIESVPCQVIIASRAEQADAFHAINGSITGITSLQLHAAAIVAGKPEAVELQDVCRRGGVEILRYPMNAQKQKPCQTRCVNIISACLRSYGADIIVTALQCVTQTANRETLGILQGPVIRALSQLLRDRPDYLALGERLFEAFDDIDIEEHLEAARAKKKVKGEVTATVLADRFKAELFKKLPDARQAA